MTLSVLRIYTALKTKLKSQANQNKRLTKYIICGQRDLPVFMAALTVVLSVTITTEESAQRCPQRSAAL